MSDAQHSDGYQRALELMRRCVTAKGFVASPTERDNYKRIWGRDGVIIGLAALLVGDDDMRQAFLETLRTLKDHQGPHGEIPSNVDVDREKVSYGGTTGRVDADLWYLIGCNAYFQATKDKHFLDEFIDSIRKVHFLLGAWEFNTRGLLYVPHTGDWSDEYVQHGYVLYDQLLYYRALQGACDLYEAFHKEKELSLCEKISHLKSMIIENYWFDTCDEQSPDVYHQILYKKGCEAAEKCCRYWMPFFSPSGYGYRFDAFANVLVSLLGIASDVQSNEVDQHIEEQVLQKDMMLLPAFYPIITPDDAAWENLQVSFSYTFKNKPYEFHNGGLWPMVTGFYVVDLAKRGKKGRAKQYLEGIDRANAMDGEEDWGFYEFIHGKNHTPGGTRHQGWSAAASIMGHHALEGSFIL